MTVRKARSDARKLEVLRSLISAGAEEIARGNVVEVDDEELEQFIDQIDCWPIARH